MGSYVRKLRQTIESDWNYAFGQKREAFKGYKAHRVNLKEEHFTNDDIDCLIRDGDDYKERSVGFQKKKYKFDNKERFDE